MLVICYWEWRQIKVFGLLAKIFRQLEFLVQARMAIEVRSRMANNRQVLATAAEVWTTFNNSRSRVAALTGAMMRSQRWWWNQSWSGNGTPLQVLAALGEETNHSLPYVYLLGVIPWLKKTNATKRSNHALMPCPPFQRHQCGFERGNLRKRRSRRSTAILLLFHSGLKLKFQKLPRHRTG